MTKKITDFWPVLALFSLFYFWGLGFISFFGLVVFAFWFFKKKNVFWWSLVIFCLANILIFRTPAFFLIFGLFFYFYLRYADSAFVATSAKEAGYGKASLRYAGDYGKASLRYADKEAGYGKASLHSQEGAGVYSSARDEFSGWFPAFLLFVSSFDLFFLASNYRFTLGVSWIVFLGLIFYLSRFYSDTHSGSDYSKIARLIFSFVFSQLFFILYFLPFGNFTNAGVVAISFMALNNYKKNHSLKQLFFLAFLCLLLLWLSGIRPR